MDSRHTCTLVCVCMYFCVCVCANTPPSDYPPPCFAHCWMLCTCFRRTSMLLINDICSLCELQHSSSCSSLSPVCCWPPPPPPPASGSVSKTCHQPQSPCFPHIQTFAAARVVIGIWGIFIVYTDMNGYGCAGFLCVRVNTTSGICSGS